MKPFIKKSITYFGASLLILGILGSLALVGAYLYLTPKLPDIETLKDVQLQVPLRVFAKDGELIAEFGEMKRSPLKYEEFPKQLVQAVLAAEDDRFFEHPGVDYQGILRAVYYLIRTGRRAQGGSTITMQVARNFFLSPEKTYLRKLNEIFLALKIENSLSKEEILSLYLNKIYLGKRAYGFAAAAQVYYGRDLADLGVAELAMIAGLPKAPSSYNPINNPERALERRNYVLGRMHELNFLDDEAYQTALTFVDDAKVHGQAIELEAPYIAEMVRNDMLERFGTNAYTAGYKVYTTLDAKRQRSANTALRDNLLNYDRRHGYRGHLGHVELFDGEDDFEYWNAQLENLPEVGNLIPAIVLQVYDQEAYVYTAEQRVAYIPWSKLEWARTYRDDNNVDKELSHAADRLAEGDLVYVTPAEQGCSWLAQLPTVSGALVSLQPEDGAVQALVGGFDYYESKFNRAMQAQRQPGSSFKPFVYTAALDKGYTAASIITDAPVVFDAPGLEDTWRPENYSGKFYGDTRLRQALVKSRNLVSIRLLRDIGIGYTIRYVSRFGFDRSMLPRDLSLALGSGAVTPMELATGYAVFANGGFRVKPYYIDYIVGPNDEIISMTNPLRACKECRKEEPYAEPLQAGESAATPDQDTAHAAEAVKPAEDKKPEMPLPPDLSETFLSVMSAQERLQVTQGPPPLKLAEQVLSPQTAFLMNTMMRDVIRFGTGRGALVLRRNDLAGKTGTTNDQRDAWFSGFNSEVVAIGWVGFDNPRPLGEKETGARAALPMWIDYMRDALKGVPEKPLQQPPGLVTVRIDEQTGKLATDKTRGAIFEYFRADKVPTEHADERNVDPTTETPSDITEQIF